MLTVLLPVLCLAATCKRLVSEAAFRGRGDNFVPAWGPMILVSMSKSWAWHCVFAVPVLGRQRQEGPGACGPVSVPQVSVKGVVSTNKVGGAEVRTSGL